MVMADNEKPPVKRKRKTPAKAQVENQATVTASVEAVADDAKSASPVQPQKSDRVAVLPLRDIVVIPHMIVPLFVGRENLLHVMTDRSFLLRRKMLLRTIRASRMFIASGRFQLFCNCLSCQTARLKCWSKVCAAQK
jgi:hypothetical protein